MRTKWPRTVRPEDEMPGVPATPGLEWFQRKLSNYEALTTRAAKVTLSTPFAYKQVLPVLAFQNSSSIFIYMLLA